MAMPTPLLIPIPARGYSAGMSPRTFGEIRHAASSPSSGTQHRPATTTSTQSDPITTLSRILFETSGPAVAAAAGSPTRGSSGTGSQAATSAAKRRQSGNLLGEEVVDGAPGGALGWRTQSEEDMVDRVVTFATQLGAEALQTAQLLSPGTALSASVGYPEPHDIVKVAVATGYRKSVVDLGQRSAPQDLDNEFPEPRSVLTSAPSSQSAGTSTDESLRQMNRMQSEARGSHTESANSSERKQSPAYETETANLAAERDAGVGEKVSKRRLTMHERLENVRPKVPLRPRRQQRDNFDAERREERLKLQVNFSLDNVSRVLKRTEAIIRYLETRRREYHEQIRQELLERAERSRLKRLKLEETHLRLLGKQQQTEMTTKKPRMKRPPMFLIHEAIPEHYKTKKYIEIETEMHPHLMQNRMMNHDKADEERRDQVEDKTHTERAFEHAGGNSEQSPGHMDNLEAMARPKLMKSLQGTRNSRKENRLSTFNHMANTALRNKKAALRLVSRFYDLPFRDLTTGMPTDNMIEIGIEADDQYDRDLNDFAALGSLSISASPDPALLTPSRVGRNASGAPGSASSADAKKAKRRQESAGARPVFTREQLEEIQTLIAQKSRRGTAILVQVDTVKNSELDGIFDGSMSLGPRQYVGRKCRSTFKIAIA
ncbi:hypothetical protein HDU96_002231 [Phlyctochytrium bullatum]|nr:hypothetical protein HDU96_002231 [Phlyctochytrium bullatum]